MSSAEYFREFMKERLTAAAEEIFSVFKTTIVQYEQEIDRQRKLLDIVWKPEVKLHRIEIPQQHTLCKQEEVHTEHQLNNKDCNSSVIQKEPEPPQIKEEQHGPFTSQEGEEVTLNQRTHSQLLTPTHKESDDCETEPESNHQPLSHNSHVTETQHKIKRKQGGSGPKRDAVSKSKQRKTDINGIKDFKRSRISRNSHIGEKPFKCETCGKAFKWRAPLERHLRVHTGEKPYSCDTCGKRFSDTNCLKHHTKIHTGEKPYSCKTCGKNYRFDSGLRAHLRKHTGVKAFICNICGKHFISRTTLMVHMRKHTGEKPYLCTICGRRFFVQHTWKRHLSIHTGEKPFTCTTCWKPFRIKSSLQRHIKTHTGEKLFICHMCGKKFIDRTALRRHMRMHTKEKSNPTETINALKDLAECQN